MHYRKRDYSLIEAFQYTGHDSIPEELKYSSSNTGGIMEVYLPGKTCERCGTYGMAHAAFLKDGFQHLICPGTYVLYKDKVILQLIDYNTFIETYEQVDVVDVEYTEEKENGKDETKTFDGRTSSTGKETTSC